MADGDPQLRMEISSLTEHIRMLTYETMGIGHQLGRIADHLTGQRTGFGPQEPTVETTAADSVQSSSGAPAVDPEDPSPSSTSRFLPHAPSGLPRPRDVDDMLEQVALDRTTAYWSDRGDHLDAVESYLHSLKDHLS